MLNLDTHIFLSLVAGRLDASEASFVTRDARWGISAIVLWEIEKLSAARRIKYDLDHPDLIAVLDTVTLWPIDRAVCLEMRRLDFRSDPADEIIAATSLAHRVPLLTRDRRLRASRVLRCL